MKEKIAKLALFLIILTFIGLGTGCNSDQNQLGENNNELGISQVHTVKPINQLISNQTKEKVITREEISDVKAVNTDKELLVALKVDNFNRFRLKKIEKKVKSYIEKMHPNHKVIVSTDKKMFWELEKIEQKLQKNKMNMKNLKKDFKKIKSLMKEQT